MGSLSHQPAWLGCLGHHCEGSGITLVTQWLRAQGFLIIGIAPMEQNLPVKNALDTSTLIYLPVVDPCSRSPINTTSIKALFVAWVRKVKTAVPEETHGAFTASPRCKFPTNPT